MLTPEYLQRAGELVGAIYTAMEAEMLAHLVAVIASGKPLNERTVTEVLLLSLTQKQELKRIADSYKMTINEAVRLTVEDALAKAADGLPSAALPARIERTIKGIAEILERDNLDMAESGCELFIQESTRAILQTTSGIFTSDEALRRAVRALEGKGLGIITYRNAKTGQQTVQNKVDVAVKRHIRTQIAQDGARYVLERMEALDVALVEVSSHADARPEHAEWQGRCYSLKGEVEIDGTVYPDFYEATGYGTVTGLCGANCRHHFGPYTHGMPRSYVPNPKHASGLEGKEVYELEQDQRLAERRIREAKRELQGAQVLFDENPDAANTSNLQRAKQKVRKRQEQMRSLIQNANDKSITGIPVLHRNYTREWIGAGEKENIKRMIANYEKGISAKKLANASAKVDLKYIASKEYRQKFQGLTNDPTLDQRLYDAVRATLTHRNGTDVEDLWLVPTAGKKRATQISGEVLGVKPTQKLINTLTSYPEGSLIGVHNHPSNIPPTGSDIAAAAGRKYAFGLVATHDGRVYYFRPKSDTIGGAQVDLRIDKYKQRGYNDTDAAINALNDFSERGLLEWRELRSK